MMREYSTLIFDLCDTIMPYRNDRKPKVVIRGEEVYTTSPLLYEYFRTHDTPIPYLAFHDHFVAATEASIELRAEGEEVLASVRFNLFLDRLNIAPGSQRNTIHQMLMQIHLSKVANCLFCPNPHRELLCKLKERFKIGLITNFDDTNTVYSILHREELHGLFDTILISSEFGMRKPRKEIFLAACQNLKISPAEALFIGDSLTSDIAGAKGVGMDAAWINPEGETIPEGVPAPDYILSTVLDLEGVLKT